METVPWRALQAGDTVLVNGNEEFPADVLLLSSSEEEARCFTETANLDGETNLKRRNCVSETASMVGVWKPDMPPLQVSDSAHAAASLRGKVRRDVSARSRAWHRRARALFLPPTPTPLRGRRRLSLRSPTHTSTRSQGP